jgi:L-Ala-D/L-Glu epimerase
VKLSWQRRNLHLKHPFQIASVRRPVSTDKQVLLVAIEHQGCIGWGEASPVSYYNQSLDSAEAVFEQAVTMLGDDPFAFDAILDPLWERFGDEPAAISAIDIALHDLAGKLMNLPVWKWFGMDPSRLPLTSFTIGLDEPAIVRQKVLEAADFPILKVKVGTPTDEAILEAVRQAAPDKTLRVDANGGWHDTEAAEKAEHLASTYRLEFIEQPTPPGRHDALAELRRRVTCPIIADESCRSPRDIARCANVFDAINIKLCKCGGIRRALEMIHVARALGLGVMLGCMVETSVGIAAAAQLAPRVDWVDLDGHLLLADDPFEGISGHAGRLTLNDRPGLGVVER